MSRKVPNINVGDVVKQRDRLAFKDFVLGVIEDTFINEFIPTSSSLDNETQTLFTLFLSPSETSQGFRFIYDELQVDDVNDYVDVFLYGVKQNQNKYDIKLYDSGNELLSGQYAIGFDEIQIIFKESITRVPTEVPTNVFTITGKIKEIVG